MKTLTLCAVLLIAGCSSHAEQAAVRTPTAVRVQNATSGPATPTIETNGMVATKDEMRLSFKVAGVIKAIYV